MKQFRLSAKKLFITYSQVHKDLTKQEILEQLQTKLAIKDYLISREYHKDDGIHFHVLLELIQRCNIRNPNVLDIIWCNETFHGNYQTARNMTALRYYLTKDKDILSSWDIDYKTGRLLSLEKKLAIMTKHNGLDNTLRYYIHNHETELDKYSRIESNLKRLDKQLIKINQAKALYNINTFEPQLKIDEAIKNKKYSTWISGPSGTRKTSYIEARVEANRQENLITDYIFIRHLDQLKQFDATKHEILIIDDCLLPHDREALISLFDMERPSAVNVKHDVITIPANVKKIFISNQTFKEMLHIRNLTNDQALIRRVKEIEVKEVIKLKQEQLAITT